MDLDRNQNNARPQMICLAAVSAVLIVFGAICTYFAMKSEFDLSLGYFAIDSLFAPVLYCVLLAGLVLGGAGWFLFRKEQTLADILAPFLPVSIISAAAALLLVISLMQEIAYTAAQPSAHLAVLLVSWVFAALFIASLIFNMTAPQTRHSPIAVLCGFFPPLYCALRVLALYFDSTTAVNSPLKLFCQLMYISFMLMFTVEEALLLERQKMFGRYIFTLTCAAVIGGSISAGGLICAATGIGGFPLSAYQLAFCLTLSLYAIIRLLALIFDRLGSPEEEEDNNPMFMMNE